MLESRTYRFGPFVLEPATHRLLRGSEEVALPPKAFELLLVLVRERGQVLSRDRLLDAVWPETAVTENTLTQRVKEVREALGDDPQAPRFIRTIPRVGYRFVAPVEEASPGVDLGRAPPATDSGPVGEPRGNEPVRPDDLEDGPTMGPANTVADAVPRRGRSTVAVAAAAVAAVGLAIVALWTRSPEGSPEPTHRLLSTFDGSHRSASFSPDGRLLAFLMEVDGTAQVWVRPLDGDRIVQVTSGPTAASRPRWSPRGDQIVFARENAGIWSVPPLGGQARQIIPEGHSPNFSADGNALVFEKGSRAPVSRRWGIWLANADGTNARQVDGVPDKPFWGEPAFPALSPDGEWIAFFRTSTGPRGDLWVVRTAGGGARRLTFDEREGGAPAWTADSRFVIFPSERRGGRTLWRVPLDGGTLEPLTSGAGAEDEPALSADGRALAYTHSRDHYAIVVMNLAATERRVLVERPSPLVLPRVSSVGDRVVFFMPVGADTHLFTMAVDGSGVRQLTHGDGQENIHPSWSWDAEFIYYYRQKPEPTFRRMRADGRDDATLVEGWRWTTHPDGQVDPSGQRAVYTRVHGDTGEYEKDTTYVRDLASGRQWALASPHLHQVRWSRDGRHVMGQRHDSTIAICPVDGGTCRVLTRGGRAVWTHDGSRVYFQRPLDSRHAELWSIGSDGSDETKLGVVGPFHPLSPNHEVTSDGRILWTEFRQGRRELWLMQWR